MSKPMFVLVKMKDYNPMVCPLGEYVLCTDRDDLIMIPISEPPLVAKIIKSQEK